MPPKRTQRAAAAKALVAMKEESTDHSDHSEDEQFEEAPVGTAEVTLLFIVLYYNYSFL